MNRLILSFFIFIFLLKLSTSVMAQQQSPGQTATGPVYNFQFFNYPAGSNPANLPPIAIKSEEKKTDQNLAPNSENGPASSSELEGKETSQSEATNKGVVYSQTNLSQNNQSFSFPRKWSLEAFDFTLKNNNLANGINRFQMARMVKTRFQGIGFGPDIMLTNFLSISPKFVLGKREDAVEYPELRYYYPNEPEWSGTTPVGSDFRTRGEKFNGANLSISLRQPIVSSLGLGLKMDLVSMYLRSKVKFLESGYRGDRSSVNYSKNTYEVTTKTLSLGAMIGPELTLGKFSLSVQGGITRVADRIGEEVGKGYSRTIASNLSINI